MVLKKVFRRGEVAPQEYMTEDRRYYIRKHNSGKGWAVFKISENNRYKFYRTFSSLQEVRELP